MVHKKLKIAIGAVLVLALGVGAFIIHQQANEREAANRKQASNIFLQSGKTSSSSKETSSTETEESASSSSVDTTQLTTNQVGEWVIASYINLKGLNVSPANFHVTVKADDDGLVYAVLYGWSLTDGEELNYRITADGTLEMFGLAENKWITAETQYREIGSYPNGIDVASVLDGDFSTLYGTWVASDGSYYTINSDNTITYSQTPANGIVLSLATADKATVLNSTIPYIGLSSNTQGAGSGLIFLYPKGVSSYYGDSSDITKDRIQAGFQPTPLTNDNVYYRQ